MQDEYQMQASDFTDISKICARIIRAIRLMPRIIGGSLFSAFDQPA
jgi:hypothetical protein